MTLLPGALISFSDPVAGLVPTLVPFQYNPAEVTRTLRVQSGGHGGPGLRVTGPPIESYTLHVELDALAVSDRPLTSTLGIGPVLAAFEAMLEPTGAGGPLGALIGAVTSLVAGIGGGGGGGGTVPAPSLPLVLLAWNPTRIVPVRVDDYSAHETGFDAALQPVQATVDLTLTVLRPEDLSTDQVLATAMASAYQAARTALAVVGMAQGVELSS
jgi:hypothetical protein